MIMLQIPMSDAAQVEFDRMMKEGNIDSVRVLMVRALATLDMFVDWKRQGVEFILRNPDGSEENFDPFMFPGIEKFLPKEPKHEE